MPSSVVVIVPLALGFWIGSAVNPIAGVLSWFGSSWILGMLWQRSRVPHGSSATTMALSQAARIETGRRAAIAGFLQPGEKVVANTPARMMPYPDDAAVGVVYLTDRRMVWNFPGAVANQIGGVPLHVLRQGAFARDMLVLLLDVRSGWSVAWFQLFPGPISSSLVAQLFNMIEKSRIMYGKAPFVRSSDPDDLLE